MKEVTETMLKTWRQSLYEARYNAEKQSPMSDYGLRRLVFVLKDINETIGDGEDVEVK